MNLSTQLYVGRIQPVDSLFNAPKNDREYINKPHGGLWTSTWHEEQGSGWIQWCLGEDWGVPPEGKWTCWHLTPLKGLEVYTIDSYEDLAQLYDRGYGRTLGRDFDEYRELPTLDFEQLAKRYDAIHLTEQGQWKTRLSHPYTLYGWDCESVLWLRWHFTVQYAGIRVFTYGDIVEEQPPLRKARMVDF